MKRFVTVRTELPVTQSVFLQAAALFRDQLIEAPERGSLWSIADVVVLERIAREVRAFYERSEA